MYIRVEKMIPIASVLISKGVGRAEITMGEVKKKLNLPTK